MITCGFKDEDQPRGVFVVENGECTRAGDYADEAPDWDMRASRKDWMKWVEKGLGMAGMGTAFAMGKLKFKHGDFKSMIKDPRMAGPFVKSFGLMQKIGATEQPRQAAAGPSGTGRRYLAIVPCGQRQQ